MKAVVREHVPAVAGLLSVVSLVLVFGAVLGAVPRSLIPHFDVVVTAVPHVNAAISATAIVVIATGVRAIRRGNVHRHRRTMLTGLALFATFLVLYLYRIALIGQTPFAGPAWIDRFVYLPLLGVHIVLAVICVPLLYYVALLALTRPVAEIPASLHPRVGRVAVSLWLVSFALGITVYLLLYWAF